MFLTGLGILSVVFGFQSFSTHFENLLKANGIHDETVEGHRTRNHSYCSILYTPISIPYKAYNGALLYWRWKCWGAAGSHKSKHLEYTAYFWKGNINNLAHFSWVITLSPPDLCFYPTGGLYKPCFCSNPWCIQV